MESMHAFDSLVANYLCADPNHPIYQTCRSYTTAGLEIGSLAIGSYGLAKGGVALAKMGWRSLSARAKTAGKVAAQEVKCGLLGTLDTRIAQLNASIDINALSRAGQVLDRNGLTKAGRSLTKHATGARPTNSLFPSIKGNSSAINKQAQEIIDDILTALKSTIQQNYRGRFGSTIEIVASDGRGIVYDINGNFLFFKE